MFVQVTATTAAAASATAAAASAPEPLSNQVASMTRRACPPGRARRVACKVAMRRRGIGTTPNARRAATGCSEHPVGAETLRPRVGVGPAGRRDRYGVPPLAELNKGARSRPRQIRHGRRGCWSWSSWCVLRLFVVLLGGRCCEPRLEGDRLRLDVVGGLAGADVGPGLHGVFSWRLLCCSAAGGAFLGHKRLVERGRHLSHRRDGRQGEAESQASTSASGWAPGGPMSR